MTFTLEKILAMVAAGVAALAPGGWRDIPGPFFRVGQSVKDGIITGLILQAEKSGRWYAVVMDEDFS